MYFLLLILLSSFIVEAIRPRCRIYEDQEASSPGSDSNEDDNLLGSIFAKQLLKNGSPKKAHKKGAAKKIKPKEDSLQEDFIPTKLTYDHRISQWFIDSGRVFTTGNNAYKASTNDKKRKRIVFTHTFAQAVDYYAKKLGFKQKDSSEDNQRLTLPAFINYNGQRRHDIAQIEYGINGSIFHRFIATNFDKFNQNAEATVNRFEMFSNTNNPQPMLDENNRKMIFKDGSIVVQDEETFVEIYDPNGDCNIFLLKPKNK